MLTWFFPLILILAYTEPRHVNAALSMTADLWRKFPRWLMSLDVPMITHKQKCCTFFNSQHSNVFWWAWGRTRKLWKHLMSSFHRPLTMMNAVLTFSTVILEFRSLRFYLASVVLRGGEQISSFVSYNTHTHTSCVLFYNLMGNSCDNVHFYHFDGSCFCKAVNTSHVSQIISLV